MATMSAIALKSPDVFLAFDLAIEFKLDQVSFSFESLCSVDVYLLCQVADQLAAKSSAIRCFKLLQKR